MRRIGYSVGLERLRERYGSLVDMYAERRKFDTSDYLELANDVWQVETGLQSRGKKRAEHMADVYAALGLFQLSQLQVQPLPGLDIAAITASLLGGAKAEQGKDLVLLHLIMEADADLFLNLLDVGFDHVRAADRLAAVIEHKRKTLSPLFVQKDIRGRIFNQVDFKAQGPSHTQKDQKPFFEQRVYAFAPEVQEKVTVSDDLIDKAIKSRRKWAEDLGLWSDGITQRGQSVLAALDNIGVRVAEGGPMVLWPYTHVLRTLRIFPEKAGIAPPTRWEVVCALAKGFGCLSSGMKPFSEETRDSGVELCREIYQRYKEADALRSKIRAQVPLFVVEPVFVIFSAVSLGSIVPLPEIIEAERRDPRRRLQLTPIRGADGGLVVS
jgi:hypothetical protein